MDDWELELHLTEFWFNKSPGLCVPFRILDEETIHIDSIFGSMDDILGILSLQNLEVKLQ